MSIKNIIRRVLKEQEEEWVDISPEHYIDLLKYVNGDGSLIKRLPDYRGKKIRVVGNLSLEDNKEISNIDSIDYIDGSLNISNTKISHFDKNKVKGSFSNWYSTMYNIEKQKILKQKLDVLEGYREDGEWDVTNDDRISNETEALFEHLYQNNYVGQYDNEDGEAVNEDKYFIWKTKYGGYGYSNMYEWLGSESFESEWVVYPDDEIKRAAYEKIKSDIEEVGYEIFRPWVWENNLDDRQVRDWLYENYEDYVRSEPEDWDISKELSSQQEKYVEIYEQKLERLNSKLENEELTDEETEEIEDEISNIEDIVEEIKENPEGEYNEDEIEDRIQSLVDDYSDDFPRYLKDHGYESNYILEFVDIDGVCEDILQDSGYGEILNGYDSTDDEYKVNGKWYHVMRHS